MEAKTGNDELVAMRDAICALKGVLYAQIVKSPEGRISEAHVVCGAGRGAKQVARDVESLLLARFGERVDHKAISVAQIEETTGREPISTHAELRLVCEGFSLSVRQNRAQGTVLLSHQGETYQGSSSGALGPFARDRILVEATLDAVHKFLGGEPVFALIETKLVTVAGAPVTLVCLGMCNPAMGDLLVGTALLRDDSQMSLVKATLCAINRRLALLARDRLNDRG